MMNSIPFDINKQHKQVKYIDKSSNSTNTIKNNLIFEILTSKIINKALAEINCL